MSTLRTHRILWSPHDGDNKFLIGSNDLRLYEFKPENVDDTKATKMIAINSDLGLMKCFAWSPDPNFQSLIAVGQTSGKTLLVNLSDDAMTENLPSSNFITSTKSAPMTTQPTYLPTSSSQQPLQLNVRYLRACNVVRFCEVEPNLLATGLEKVRNDYSLLIWDLEQATNSSIPTASDYKRQFSGPKISPDQPISRTGSISGWSDRGVQVENFGSGPVPIITDDSSIIAEIIA
ncbi:hypothetical protein G9A89_003248 [Geosiphon pyriformis]|nr:hypothetical protein G9A89_003248 [Geosiphon pyriformis]